MKRAHNNGAEGAPAGKRVKREAGGVALDDVVALDEETAEDYIKRHVEEAKDGLPLSELQKTTNQFDKHEIAIALNKLVSSNELELASKGKTHIVRSVNKKDQKAVKGMTQEERHVYNVIRDAGNKGIWTRDIRYSCNLQMPALNKLLKSMETRRLVKSCKSVLQSKKKVYMLYELEPDRSLTGGAWYSEQSFDDELVSLLSQKVYKYIVDKSNKAARDHQDPLLKRENEYVTSEEVHEHVKESKVFLVEFSPQEIEQITRALELDGKLECTKAPLSFKHTTKGSTAACAEDDSKLYRARREAESPPMYQETPRGVTPVFTDKSKVGTKNHLLLMAQALL